MDSEENEVADEDEDDRNHKHQRRDSSRLAVPNENSTPAAEEPSTVQPTKKRVRPFEHSSKFGKRHFRSTYPFHSRGTAGPAMMKLALPRQRCPDFEELGYCLRGDMCPMEHGVNRIMVEDIQTLLQLKRMGVNQPDPDADVYDPDQPLWANSQSVASPNHTSAGTATGPDADVYNPDEPLWANGMPMASPNHTSAGTATGASSNELSYHPDPGPSVWGRIEKTHQSHGQKEPTTRPDSMHGDSTSTGNTGAGCQRASRTLFIRGIPQKDNRPKALFSHFKKFGRVTDIYVPSNSDKAFVQFSKREEAEAALLAPDAVLGNFFIKMIV